MSAEVAGAQAAPVEVAVGVVVRPDGAVLLASRPEGKPYAGYWEFPGGKLEAGESVEAALVRELHEELGLVIDRATPWITIEHVYPHAHVRLHFTRVTAWRGEPEGREGQVFEWVDPRGPLPQPLLPAAVPCIRWLALPPLLGVSNAAALGAQAWLAELERALARGLRFVQLREPDLDTIDFDALLTEALVRTRAAGARLVVNARHGVQAAQRADGLHLRAVDLARLEARPDLRLVGASVHTRDELDRASALALDYVVLGPVLPTATHAHASPLGWSEFAARAGAPGLPVYAIGGLAFEDLAQAQAHGAHGIAALRAAWR